MAGPPSSSFDPDTGIRVVIKPAQSSFFAGEPFRVSITFVNTHPPTDLAANTGHSPLPSSALLHRSSSVRNTANTHVRSASYSQSGRAPSPTLLAHRNGSSSSLAPNSAVVSSNISTTRKFHHKRGAHSISSAPLARPPTSPGTPRSPVVMQAPSLMARAKSLGVDVGRGPSEEKVGRKGLVGVSPGKGKGKETPSVSPSDDGKVSTKPSPTEPSPAVTSAVALEKSSSSESEGAPTSDRSETKENPAPIVKSKLDDNPLPQLIEQRRKRQLGKSLSVSVANANEYDPSRAPPSPNPPSSSSQPPPNSKRTHTLALSQSHPHARKHSVVDLDIQPHAVDPRTMSTTPTASNTPSSSLHPIVEASRTNGYDYRNGNRGLPSYPNTPMVGDPYMVPASPLPTPSFASRQMQAYPIGHSQANGIGLGHPSSNRKELLDVPGTAGSSVSQWPESELGYDEENKELILYSYAQLLGHVKMTPLLPGANIGSTGGSAQVLGSGNKVPLTTAYQPTKDHRDKMRELREGLLKKGAGGVVGGGSMDINSMVGLGSAGGGLSSGGRRYTSNPYSNGPASAGGRRPSSGSTKSAGHARSSSLTAGLFALLSPATSFIGFGVGEEDESVPEEEEEQVYNEKQNHQNPPYDYPDQRGPHTVVPKTAPPNATWTVSNPIHRSSSSPYSPSPLASSSSLSGSSPSPPSSPQIPPHQQQPHSAGVGLGLSGVSGPPSHRAHHQRTASMVRIGSGGPSSASIPQPHSRRSSISNFFGFNFGGGEEEDEADDGYGGGGFRTSGSGASGFLTMGSGGARGGAIGKTREQEEEEERKKYDYDSDAPLPTLETQPAMLAVDLTLRPGEEKTYTYTLMLPDNLPPTFRGKSIKFSYELVVGLCRSGNGNHKISKLMKVPIRLYNSVSVERPQKPYNLLWPVHKRMDLAMPSSQAKVTEEPVTSAFGFPDSQSMAAKQAQKKIKAGPGTLDAPGKAGSASGSLAEIKSYARRLVEALPPPEATSRGHDSGSGSASRNSSTRSSSELQAQAAALRRELDQEREDVDESMVGCREAVEILTRTPKKASYDVTKDGVKVAVLTFSKSSFRLGETIAGVVELNEKKGRSRVLQLSAFLEAHEALPSSISPAATNRHLKRTYAEHFSSVLINTLRTSFSLDIPSDASPAFKTYVGPQQRPDQLGGVEWKVRLCLLVAIASEHSDPGTEGVRFKSLVKDGPRGEWGSSWKALEIVKPLEKWRPSPLHHHHHLAKRASSTTLSSPVSPTSPYGAKSSASSSWAAFFASYIVPTGTSEREYHDGDDMDDSGDEGRMSRDSLSMSRTSRDGSSMSSFGDAASSILSGTAVVYDGVKPDPAGGVGVGVDFEGGEEGWREVKLETVECEVPVRVWPGNTAFRAMDVVFEV